MAKSTTTTKKTTRKPAAKKAAGKAAVNPVIGKPAARPPRDYGPPVQGEGKHLVIVESPTKAKTINKYLGRDYVVMASVGHVRDLPARAPKGANSLCRVSIWSMTLPLLMK